MKAQKGVTLIALVAYVIAMSIVVTMLSILSQFFFKNANFLTQNSKNIAEYNKFAMYFIEDVKNNKDTMIVTDNQIAFADGTVYTFAKNPDNSIYRNKVKICNNIVYCKFSKKEEEMNNITKKIIQVYMVIQSESLFETNNEFVLRYW